MNQVYLRKADVKIVFGLELGLINSLDPDQDRQNVRPDLIDVFRSGPDLRPNCLQGYQKTKSNRQKGFGLVYCLCIVKLCPKSK